MSKAKHTPTPWKWPESTRVGCGRRIPAGTQQQCHEMPDGLCNWHVPSALHAHIVRAVNAHERLVEALKRCKSYLTFDEGKEPSGLRLITCLEMLDAAIAAAEDGQ